MLLRAIPTLLLASLLAAACGDMGAADEAGGGWPNMPDATSGDAGPGAGLPDTAEPPPPEEERDFDLRTPEAGATRLFIPSAALDALIVVEPTTLAVRLVEVGVRPTVVRALPADAGAIVLNAGTHDVSVVRPAPDTDGGWDVTTLDVAPNANRLTVSPDGAWAFAWFTATGQAGEPIGSLQDVTAIRLAPGDEAVFDLAVGLRPSEVRFAAGGERALVLCEDGLSVVDLTALDGDRFLPPVAVHDDPFVTPHDREVVVTPDGQLAVVRDLNRAELTLVDLDARTRRVLPLPDWPSDLDLTPSGQTVVVPLRGAQQLAVIAIPAAFEWAPLAFSEDLYDTPDAGSTEDPDAGSTEDPDASDDDADAGPTDDLDASVPDEDVSEPTPTVNPHVTYLPMHAPFGAAELSADGQVALLYTTLPGTAAVGLADLEAGEVTVRPVAKEVTAALLSPAGDMAALLHRKSSGAAPPIQGSDAYSLVDLASGYTKLVLTPQPPSRFLFTPGADELIVLLPDPAGLAHLFHRTVTTTFSVTPHPVPYAPLFVGALPLVSKVAILLDDPTGWLTLLDTATGQLEQLNGFELNAFIR